MFFLWPQAEVEPWTPGPGSEFEQIAERLVYHSYLGPRVRNALEERLNSKGLTANKRLRFRTQIFHLLLGEGEVEQAYELTNTLLKRAESLEPPDDKLVAHYLYLRGVANLRRGETENCVSGPNPASCIYPIREQGRYTRTVSTTLARNDFEASLDLHSTPQAKWLLAVARSLLGEGTAAEFAPINPSPFKTFENVAEDIGLDSLSIAGSIIAEDFNGDGWLDVIASSASPYAPLRLYENQKDGTFKEKTEESNLAGQLGGLGCTVADFDNDGDADILVLRGAWHGRHGRIRNSLLENLGDGQFRDVTRRSGLAKVAYPSQTGAWADFDNDGWLDLYIGNESPYLSQTGTAKDSETSQTYPSQLFRNNQDGTFTDIAEEAGVQNWGPAKGVAVGDIDNDGDMDLFVANFARRRDPTTHHRLYRNDGDFSFSDMAEELGLTGDDKSRRGLASWFFDVDNDGWLDLFVGGKDGPQWKFMQDYSGRSATDGETQLFHNQQGRRMSDVTEKFGLNRTLSVMGASFGDLDNDGFLDIYLGTGAPTFDFLIPNIMLRNQGGTKFQDVTASGGFGHLQKGHGICFADIDNDGDQDVLSQLGGALLADIAANAVFQNPGNNFHWIQIQLEGRDSPRSGSGARLKLEIEEQDGPREVHRAVGSISSFGYTPRRQEIGLGSASSVKKLTIQWPRTKKPQVFHNVPVDQSITIVEGEDLIRKSETARAGPNPSTPQP